MISSLYQRADLLRSDAPFEVLFLLTTKCNLRCTFCCEQGTELNREIHQMSQYVRPLVNDLGVTLIDLNGGEPLLRKKADILNLLKIIANQDALASISTNALILDEQYVRELSQYTPIVNVSLHGVNYSTHDKLVRVPCAHDKIIKNIRRLITHDIDVHVTSIVLNENINEMPALAELCYKEGAETFCMNVLFGRGRGKNILHEQHQTVATLLPLRDALRKQYGKSLHIYVNESNVGQCVLVRPNGLLVGAPQNPKCANDGLISIGDVLDKDISEKWNSYAHKENHRTYNREKFARYFGMQDAS